MLAYYALFIKNKSEPPAGIFAMDVDTGDAILWDHRAKAWSYDPALVDRFLDDFRNMTRYESVGRERAEQITPTISGGEPLPDEETIRWIFQWKGDPPQPKDIGA